MPRSEPKGGLEASKTTAYNVGIVGQLGTRTSETILEAAKNSLNDELGSMPESFRFVSDLAKKAISSIPGAKDNPIGAGLFTIAGFITNKKEDISNNELLKSIKLEMHKMENRIYKMFQARPYAELANALDLFEAFKSQGPQGDGLKWLKQAENAMNVNLRTLMRLMLVNPGSSVALDMLGHLITQGQIYMSILDTLCSVDRENAPGYSVLRKNFGRDAAREIKRYLPEWKKYLPIYIERTGGFLGLFGPFGYRIMYWADWIGGHPPGQWTLGMSASHGWEKQFVKNPMSCPNFGHTINNFLSNRHDKFGYLTRLLGTASIFESWAQ